MTFVKVEHFEYGAKQLLRHAYPDVVFLDAGHAVEDGYEVGMLVDRKPVTAFVSARHLRGNHAMMEALDRAIDNAIRDARMVVHVDCDQGDENDARAQVRGGRFL